MRINKYRGRRSYDKKWIYGSLLIDNNGDFHILESNIIEKDGHHIYIDSDSPMFFDNDTIGQFTGLHDKNGVEIYENDIVKGKEWENGKSHRHIGVVEYIGSSFKSVGIGKYLGINGSVDGSYEVIGNIHERSEDDGPENRKIKR